MISEEDIEAMKDCFETAEEAEAAYNKVEALLVAIGDPDASLANQEQQWHR